MLLIKRPLDPTAGNRVDDILLHNQDLRFNESVFREAMKDLNLGDQADELVDRLTKNPTIEEMLRQFAEGFRGHILKIYANRFTQTLVT